MITSCQERDAKLLTNILCDFTVFFLKKKSGLKPSLIKSKTDLKKIYEKAVNLEKAIKL